jgi:light-regulated signal transduction histidine kinase (bacteriophytochrome)
MFMLFGVFLLAGGTAHFMEVVTLYYPIYRFSGLVLAITALASIGTCTVFLYSIPPILRIPSNAALAREVQEHRKIDRQLRELQIHLEDRVRERTTELETRNEDLKQFAFAVSHDLQEPLRMMAIYSELLGRRYAASLEDEAKQYIAQIIGGSQRMSRLLEDLLTYAQLMRQDANEHEQCECSPEVVLAQVLADLGPQIELSEASITWSTLPVVQVSKMHLHQVFLNLIGNAVKYRGKRPPNILISGQEQGDECLFSIKDNGIGIAPPYHRQIFGLFKRLHGKELPGTGMGLSICQKIIERYGGRIWVESQEQKGATFNFRLPMSSSGSNMSMGAKKGGAILAGKKGSVLELRSGLQ